jgi:7,8-dihydropterin-6-yl-methyl-4-(beta-D-ribofuranosyl)aminobenzene 5'-phosphate synthase
MPRPGMAHRSDSETHEPIMIRIKVLIENTAFQPDVISEHGLSLFIQVGSEQILFDTGQSGAFMKNASIYGCKLEKTEKMIISHGHYDHTGGLPAFLKENKKVLVYCKKEALIPKFSHNYNEKRQINLPLIDAYKTYTKRFVFLSENFRISPEILVVTDILNKTKFENDEQNLTWKTGSNNEKDPFDDELFLILEENDGITIVTGCSHRGIINIIHTANKLFPAKKIKHVVGGFHLKNKSHERMKPVLKELNKFPIGQLDICHCTGIEEYGIIKNEFKGKTQYLSTGTLLKI